MKTFFSILTIGLIVIGFVAPIAWIGAVITGIIAIGSARAGKRADGKAKTGGLFGGLWDNFRVASTMIDCPFCKSKIMKEASKCPNCAEWVKKPESDSQKTYIKNESAGSGSIKAYFPNLDCLNQ